MRMNELKIVNKEFISLLDELAVQVDKVFEKKDFLAEQLKEMDEHRNPVIRSKQNKDPFKVAPHYFELPPTREQYKERDGWYDPVGRAYLSFMQDLMRIDHRSHVAGGFPNRETFIPAINFYNKPSILEELGVSNFRELIYDISARYLGGGSMALCAFYPPDSYIPWHHNGNAPGYNILLHYNKEGKGAFYTLDDDEIIEYPDKTGWVCRAGQFLDTHGHESRAQFTTEEKAGPENASWHAAHAITNRFTLSTITNDKFVWEDLIDEIQGN
jgi:hypothetical protein